MTAALCCWNCGVELATLVLPVSRRADCPECRAELHCCRMCRHFDRSRPAQCREDRAEPPTNKEVANFCDWFEPASGLAGVLAPEDRARARLDALFGGVPAQAGGDADGGASQDPSPDGADDPDPAANARRRLDDLFD
ncbi:MAG: hypothetical protein V2J24_10665 [Pseudomonadales bacterium]|jgi:hypothetical protein|nr:hypothetical protein [Pseudomonadales bacterium]